MVDLAINTTLESKTLAAQTPCSCADFPCSGNWGSAIWLVFGKEFPNFALLFIRVDLVEISMRFLVEIKDSSITHCENQSRVFSGNFWVLR
ncbi:hypothetical protein GQ457_10G009710 [Hibiscus cannabinus]